MQAKEERRRRVALWLACFAICLVPVFCGLGFLGAQASESREVDTFKAVAQVVYNKCMACHSEEQKLPFYATLPGISQVALTDYNKAQRAVDLEAEVVEADSRMPLNESLLAKMEWVVLYNAMPPATYRAVHWGSRLTQNEQQLILEWVKESRVHHYATGFADSAHANEPLQPLPDIVMHDPEKAALGRVLFSDKRLSDDGTLACISCHDLVKAGTDNQRFVKGVRGHKGSVNVPTIFNVVFHSRQFWDGRAASLLDQVNGPAFNAAELGNKSWDSIIERLSQDTALTERFIVAYPDGWTGGNITHALAEYEKTLITPHSHFDRWLKGEENALTENEKEGYALFKAYKCASCHVGAAVGGQTFEYMGRQKNYFKDRGPALASDVGLMAYTQDPEDKHKFKVPALRNVELTGPYFHDGTVTTLDEAVKKMGVYLTGLYIPEFNRAKIVAFLRTLTGEHEGKKLTGLITPM